MTPEEQLLKLIEDPAGMPSVVPASMGTSTTMKNPLERLGSWWRSQRTRLFDLHAVTRLLWTVLLLLAFLVAWEVLTPRRMRVEQPGAHAPKASTAAPVLVGGAELPLKPLSTYLDGFQRNPFTGTKTEQPVTPEAAAMTAKSKLDELAGTLKVVGVGRAPQPEALIEDSARQRTVVVKVGEDINGLTVTDISAAGVVTVSYDGETKELH